MSHTHNKRSVMLLKCGDAIEVCNRVVFNCYMGLTRGGLHCVHCTESLGTRLVLSVFLFARYTLQALQILHYELALRARLSTTPR